MESNGFYVTLPSNSSIDIYPNNTLTKYIVRLPRTLYLKEGFEVALAEKCILFHGTQCQILIVIP